MARAMRSEYAASVALDANARERRALETWPRLASVRLLHVAQRRRERERERAARLAACGLVPLLFVWLFTLATQ